MEDPTGIPGYISEATQTRHPNAICHGALAEGCYSIKKPAKYKKSLTIPSIPPFVQSAVIHYQYANSLFNGELT
jgi:hypothetical protein